MAKCQAQLGVHQEIEVRLTNTNLPMEVSKTGSGMITLGMKAGGTLGAGKGQIQIYMGTGTVNIREGQMGDLEKDKAADKKAEKVKSKSVIR